MSPIPVMTNPQGAYWRQPDPSKITFYRDRAYMTQQTFGELLNYSTTVPTGVYPGKMWRTYGRRGWQLCWWEDATSGMALTSERSAAACSS